MLSASGFQAVAAPLAASKAAMRLRGLPGTDAVRVPYQPLDASEYNTLRAAMDTCDDALAKLGRALQQSAESGQ